MQLYNRVDRKVLEAQMANSDVRRITLSFYKYHQIGNPQLFRNYLYARLDSLRVLGRIYVAHEGVNGQISVPKEQYHAMVQELDETRFLSGIRLNIAIEDDGKSFIKLIIKVRSKIVADGLNDRSFDVTRRGKHLDAEEFNALASDPNTVIVDMRNHYESEVGHFEGAICPDVDTFRDSLPVVEDILKPHKNKNILMYCTGGIRCEKASAWFKHRGFEKVHQLNGGIIEYARQVQQKGLENKFKGKNFVFDNRLGERISDEVLAQCHQCGAPCDTHTNCENAACHLLFIQCADCAAKYEGCCSYECHEFNQLPEETQKELRKNIDYQHNVYHKGRVRPKLRELISEQLRSLKKTAEPAVTNNE
ncbi:MAG: rhodanese-related sulfurtransferase [Cryomorphaceae bacterium]|nr:MAG: rhodanese-related sulfurtransferase [Cryomorphaceae bacterium]